MGFFRPSRHDQLMDEGRSSSSLRDGDGVWVTGASTFDSIRRRRVARKKVGKSSTASLACGRRRRSKRLRSDAAPGRGGDARHRAVARRVRRGVAAVRRSRTSALSPRARPARPRTPPPPIEPIGRRLPTLESADEDNPQDIAGTGRDPRRSRAVRSPGCRARVSIRAHVPSRDRARAAHGAAPAQGRRGGLERGARQRDGRHDGKDVVSPEGARPIGGDGGVSRERARLEGRRGRDAPR